MPIKKQTFDEAANNKLDRLIGLIVGDPDFPDQKGVLERIRLIEDKILELLSEKENREKNKIDDEKYFRRAWITPTIAAIASSFVVAIGSGVVIYLRILPVLQQIDQLEIIKK